MKYKTTFQKIIDAGFKHRLIRDRILCVHADCMDVMELFGENEFDLGLVDPPYGIGISKNPFRKKHNISNWDKSIPDNEYFNRLFEISINQIIWGGNYFDLPPSQGFFIWDKKQPFNFTSSMCEFAWTNMNLPAKIFRLHVVTAEQNKIHPTQMPIALYSWTYKNYSEPDQITLDTHGGSGSNAIAAYYAGNPIVIIEKDDDYFPDMCVRIERETAQADLFQPHTQQPVPSQASLFDQSGGDWE